MKTKKISMKGFKKLSGKQLKKINGGSGEYVAPSFTTGEWPLAKFYF